MKERCPYYEGECTFSSDYIPFAMLDIERCKGEKSWIDCRIIQIYPSREEQGLEEQRLDKIFCY